MYSNIVLAGVWKYIPFAWAIDLSRYVLDDKLSLHKNEVFIMGLITIIAFYCNDFLDFTMGRKTMIKKMILLVVAILLMGASMTGCSVLEKGIDEYSKDKEECVLNTDNVTQFTYKGDSFTILDDTLSNSELGEWVGYIRKLAVIDSNGKILLQQDTEKATFKTLADIADSKPDAAYIIPFLNVYTVKDGNTQELIVDVNGGYHKAILNRFVTDKDTIFRYNQKTEATAEGEFTINTQNCTQLLCGDKVYQITDETVPYENIGEYIDIIAESYTFDNDTKLQIPKEELYHIDWSGKEKSSQKREQWTMSGIYEILHKDRTDSVAVEVNSEYRVAKCQ